MDHWGGGAQVELMTLSKKFIGQVKEGSDDSFEGSRDNKETSPHLFLLFDWMRLKHFSAGPMKMHRGGLMQECTRAERLEDSTTEARSGQGKIRFCFLNNLAPCRPPAGRWAKNKKRKRNEPNLYRWVLGTTLYRLQVTSSNL